MDIELDKNKRRFFDDEKLMHKKFGPYARYIEPYYLKLCEYAPEISDELFFKLFNTKIKFGTKDVACDAYSIRIRLDGRPTNSVRIDQQNPSDRMGYDDKGEYVPLSLEEAVAEGVKYHLKALDAIDDEFHGIEPLPQEFDLLETMKRHYRKSKIDKKLNGWMRMEDNNRNFSVLHELNHCMANKKLIWLKKDKKPQTYFDALRHAVKVDVFTTDQHNVAEVYGNSGVLVYDVFWGKMVNMIFSSARSSLYENAIVDDMANSIGCELGLCTTSLQDYYKSKPGPAYRPFVYLVGMWNLVSNNDLRREYLTGKNKFDTEGTYGFETLFNSFARFCIPAYHSDANKVGYLMFSYDLIASQLVGVVQFTDKKYKQNARKMTADQRKLYRFYRKQVLDPNVLLDFMEEYTDFRQNRDKIADLLGKKYFQNMHTRQDLSVEVDPRLQEKQSLIM